MISINFILDTQESITLQDWNTRKKYECKLSPQIGVRMKNI